MVAMDMGSTFVHKSFHNVLASRFSLYCCAFYEVGKTIVQGKENLMLTWPFFSFSGSKTGRKYTDQIPATESSCKFMHQVIGY